VRPFALVMAAAVAVACGTASPEGSGTTAAPSPDGGASGSGGTDAGTGAGDGGTADGGTGGGAGDGGTADAGTGGGTATGPQQITTGANAFALAIDATSVYWLSHDGSGDAVRSVPKSGGAATTLSAARSGHPALSLVATGDAVLWEGLGCPDPCDYPGAGHEWAIFSFDGGSVHRVAELFAAGGLAASATTAFSRSFDLATGRWDLLGCARDGSGCSRLVYDNPLVPPVYFDSAKLYYLSEPTDTDFGPRSILGWYDPSADSFHQWGSMTLQNVQGISGLRVDRDAFGVRSHGNVWAGHLNSTYSKIWGAPNGDDVDINHGRIYWNQSRTDQFPGCLGSANLDGTDGKCLDEGDHSYADVRVDESAVYFIRDGEIFRLSK
jgi:hypothetical protein